MLMFENGLLATFIPEILMVIGFVLCLFTPSFKAQNSSTEQIQVVVQLSSSEHHQISGYQLSISDFQTENQVVTDSKPPLPRFIEKKIRCESVYSTADGINYVDFSRPPPSLNIR